MFRYLLLVSFATYLFFHDAIAKESISKAITQPIPLSELTDFNTYPIVVQKLIRQATDLTKLNLTYLFGSAEPKNKGMDCSGTIYYLLSHAEVTDVPRQSNEIYTWVEKQGKLIKVNSRYFNSPEFSQIKPGDLLFWSGTYNVNRYPPISHVMLYLGKNAKGKRLMFGSSNGRTYLGKKMWGVSVFDFKLPDGKSESKFVGYGCIPHLTC